MSENAWIEWKGGPMPVSGDVVVDIRTRDAGIERGYRARNLDWVHRTAIPRSDIIAYRLSGPSA